MKKFTYRVTDPVGIHARPAGLLVKEAAKFSSKVTITKGAKSVDLKRLFGVMALGVKQGDEITITCDGADETEAASSIEAFLKANL
ncbi:MAG: HPr family phosphocarrier protein [Phascolarctobacterium sp.]|nr:HPr family phosphocarrier protein [Phascolarctobacterium sp.]